jgi:2-acylglycerol O-acyltransferase 2
MILSIIVPPDFPPRVSKMIGNWIMIQSAKYFGLTTTIEDEDALREESSSVIFAFEPHDIVPYAVFAFNPVLKRIPGKVGESQQCLMSSAIFHIPFLRNIYSWICGAPITKAMFRKKLALGESFVFVPGGIQGESIL